MNYIPLVTYTEEQYMYIDNEMKNKLFNKKFFLLPKFHNRDFNYEPELDTKSFNYVIKSLIQLKQQNLIDLTGLEETDEKINPVKGACITLDLSKYASPRKSIGVQHTADLCDPNSKQNVLSVARAIYLKMSKGKQTKLSGLDVAHTCGNGRCINPFHLHLATPEANRGFEKEYENMLKRIAKKEKLLKLNQAFH